MNVTGAAYRKNLSFAATPNLESVPQPQAAHHGSKGNDAGTSVSLRIFSRNGAGKFGGA